MDFGFGFCARTFFLRCSMYGFYSFRRFCLFVGCFLACCGLAHAGQYGITAGAVEVATGSQYRGQSVTSASLLAVAGTIGGTLTGTLGLSLADGTAATIAEPLVLNGAKCLNLVGLCTANPAACGAVAGVAVAAIGTYFALQAIDGSLNVDQPTMSALAKQAASNYENGLLLGAPALMTKFPNSFGTIRDGIYLASTGFPAAFLIYYPNYRVAGNVVFPTYITTQDPTVGTIATSVDKDNHPIPSGSMPVYQSINKDSFSSLPSSPGFSHPTPLNDTGAASVVASIAPVDLDLSSNGDSAPPLIPDVFEPVSISDDATPSSYSGTTSTTQALVLNNDGTVTSYTPDAVATLPADATGVVTTSPDDTLPVVNNYINTYTTVDNSTDTTTPSDSDLSWLQTLINAITNAFSANRAAEKAEANQDMIDMTAVDSSKVNFQDYFNYGSHWLPSDCPPSFEFTVMGKQIEFSYDSVCTASSDAAPFVLIFAALSFVVIIFGGIK